MNNFATFQDGTIIDLFDSSLEQEDKEHGVFFIFEPNTTVFDKLDLDGNRWSVTFSNNFNCKFTITLSNGTIKTPVSYNYNTVINTFTFSSEPKYYAGAFLELDSNGISFDNHRFNGSLLNDYIGGVGLNGVTYIQSKTGIVNFPNEGNWQSGLSIQRIYELYLSTKDTTNYKNVCIANCFGTIPGSRYSKIETITHITPFITLDEIRHYFANTFGVEGGLISKCTITLDRTTYFYTGSAITPLPKVVSINGNTLVKDLDYTLSYIDNVKLGTAQITVTGIDLWEGTGRVYFTIVSNGDPYSGGGIATIGGGDGSFDSTSDTIHIPSLPTLSSLQSSLINLWAPTSLQLSSLVSWLWSSAFDLDSLKKLFASPMDMIMGLSIVPVSVPTTSDTVKFGLIDSNVSMYKATQQYAIVDCGDINLEPFWGSYLDYSPYTKIDIFLPYIGYQHLDPDVLMDSTINVTYHVDVLSGSCVAFVCSNENILYTFMGNCATHIPISANDWSSFYTSLARLVSNTASYAIGGASVGGVAGGVAGAAVGAASSLLTSSIKPVIGKSGTISSDAGLLNLQKPHLVINRPRQALPEMQNTYTGYPAFITSPLTSLIGYTEVESIHLDNVPATDAELDEILEILHNGFVI